MDERYDKLELSPNNLAHCQCCRRRIVKNAVRIGKWEYSNIGYWRYNGDGYIMRYYHRDCMPQLIPTLNLEPRYRKRKYSAAWPEIEAQRKQSAILERYDLRETIRKWRLQMARMLQTNSFYIFNDETLDQIVDEMPDTEEKLLGCYGIGSNKAKRFGPAIIGFIREYKENHGYTPSSDQEAKKSPPRSQLKFNSHEFDAHGPPELIHSTAFAIQGPTKEEDPDSPASTQQKHDIIYSGQQPFPTPVVSGKEPYEARSTLNTDHDSKRHALSREEYDALHRKVSNISMTCNAVTDVEQFSSVSPNSHVAQKETESAQTQVADKNASVHDQACLSSASAAKNAPKDGRELSNDAAISIHSQSNDIRDKSPSDTFNGTYQDSVPSLSHDDPS